LREERRRKIRGGLIEGRKRRRKIVRHLKEMNE
jgi:hypothetical protein